MGGPAACVQLAGKLCAAVLPLRNQADGFEGLILPTQAEEAEQRCGSHKLLKNDLMIWLHCAGVASWSRTWQGTSQTVVRCTERSRDCACLLASSCRDTETLASHLPDPAQTTATNTFLPIP